MKHEMKLGLQNYAFIIPIDMIKFNNKKMNSLHMTLHKITEIYTNQFSDCPSITSKCRTTTIFKISCDSNKTCRYSMIFHCTKRCLFKCNV
jgi:hypothetical protein